MEKQKAIDVIEANAVPFKKLGVTALFLYGSTARNEAEPGSDIDIFIDTDRHSRFSLFDLMELKHTLEDETGIPVDVTTRDGLHPRLRERIEKSAVRVF
jgi:uncharacterized protein